MNKKNLLLLLAKVISAIGIILVSIPFVMSLSVNGRQENSAWKACDVSYLEPGELKRCDFVTVYRRTKKDKEYIDKFEYLLQDPKSEFSQQPDNIFAKWRSYSSEYFVFLPYAPSKFCGLRLLDAGEFSGYGIPENEAIDVLPFFHEPCDGRTWDTSGRLYLRKNHPQEFNLIVPEIIWNNRELFFVKAS